MPKKKNNQQCRKSKKIATPYDDAFRSMYTRCGKLVLFLLNEAFGTDYDGKEPIRFLPNESFLPLSDVWGKIPKGKRISDSQFEVEGHDGERRRFQVECQSSADTSMSMRVLEYSLAFANTYAEITRTKVRAEIQNVAVLYLRVSPKTPDAYEIELVAPNKESIAWEVPIIKAPKYSKDEIFARKLYFLVPFYFFAFEDRFEAMCLDKDERQGFFGELESILQQVEALEEQGTLDSAEMFSIIDNCKVVLDALADKFPKIKKGVSAIMAGRDYRTKSQKLQDETEARVRTEERLSSIRNIMEEFHVSAQRAMEALKIPTSERKKYAAQLR